MATENQPYHYNYQRLDNFLNKDTDPKEIGNELDEIMGDLVNYSGKEEGYRELLPNRHTILRELRDIFWSLKKSE
jgi:succinate dehydrogenase/fumarate reductase flavoprotein subunit